MYSTDFKYDKDLKVLHKLVNERETTSMSLTNIDLTLLYLYLKDLLGDINEISNDS